MRLASAAPGRRPTGFTLIEMVAVVAIVGVLAAAATPLLELTMRRSQELALRQSLRTLRAAIDAHKLAYDEGRIALKAGASGYPASLSALAGGVPDARAPDSGKRLYFLRRVPRDPFADPTLPAEQTWSLRSSDSPPDAPTPGSDVFDVASRSDARALDGTFYREW